MFSTLNPTSEERRRRGLALICGVLAEALVIGAAAIYAVLFPSELPVIGKHYVVAWLPPLTQPEKPLLKPPPQVVRVVLPKLAPPDPPKLPAPSVAEIDVPKIQHPIPPAPVPVVEARSPAPPDVRPSPPAKEQIAVHTEVFGGAPQPITTKRPAEMVQTGGFGSPQGFAGQAQGESRGNVPKLGSFGLPEGPGVGNGTGGAHGIQGVVASAGFGSGVAGMGDGHGGGGAGEARVATGGFEKMGQATRSPASNPRVAAPVAEFQPVEILSKPSPAYTEEARRLAIQGEVVLSVIFQATGEIKVLGVVKSLGHGLDEAAQQAATQIRFKPAQRSGQPADFPATLRIEFRLAGQST